MKISFDSTPYVQFLILFLLIGPLYINLRKFIAFSNPLDGIWVLIIGVLEIGLAISIFKSMVKKIRGNKVDKTGS